MQHLMIRGVAEPDISKIVIVGSASRLEGRGLKDWHGDGAADKRFRLTAMDQFAFDTLNQSRHCNALRLDDVSQSRDCANIAHPVRSHRIRIPKPRAGFGLPVAKDGEDARFALLASLDRTRTAAPDRLRVFCVRLPRRCTPPP